MTKKELKRLEKRARDQYGSGDIEIDPLKEEDVSSSDDGDWVRVWVWLDKEKN